MGRRAKVDMADKETKVKELTEPVGTCLLRLYASNPSDFIKNVVAKIIVLKDRLATKLCQLEISSNFRVALALPTPTFVCLPPQRHAKALYPTQQLQRKRLVNFSHPYGNSYPLT